MFFKIQKNPKGLVVYLVEDIHQLQLAGCSKEETAFVAQRQKNGQGIIELNYPAGDVFLVFPEQKKDEAQKAEALRKQGPVLQKILNKVRAEEITIINLSADPKAAFHLAEGVTLANYQFLKYKTDAKKLKNSLESIYFARESLSPRLVNQLQVVMDAVYHVRDLVNEPLQYLTAEQFAKDITALGKEGRFRVQVLGKAKLEQMNMGGILAVNRGSVLPPTFTIMEHRPAKALNKKPIVLIGKGIVYDTGGLSLKPTKNSMDRMKCDMSGGALVTGLMYIAGQLDLPLHLIALVPATENRPGVNAYVPGDVIKMYSGTTVEVLNTDAEGRLVLADALHYAKKYQPELVLDFATLTGAAANAIGDAGIVYMGNASEEMKQQCCTSGSRQYERLVEFPLWEEYSDMLQSDIADLKNVGGPVGGAITAGKFLEHFTDYPWLHFDIAGVSFHTAAKDYRPYGGTAYGLRMMADFLLHYGKKRE
jgi:leucyl aminopeptidase